MQILDFNLSKGNGANSVFSEVVMHSSPSTDCPVPAFVSVAERIWDGGITRSSDWAATAGQLDQFESIVSYGEWTDQGVDCAIRAVKDLNSKVREMRKNIARRFIEKVAKELGVGTQPADIDTDDLQTAARMGLVDKVFGDDWEDRVNKLDRIDFEKTWRFLYARYGAKDNEGTSLGERSARQSAAKSLISDFWLSRTAPEFKSGNLILTRTEYWDSKYSGGWNHESGNTVARIAGNLNIVFSFSGLEPIFKSDTRKLADYASSNRTVPNGEKFPLGDHITVRPFKGKFEYRLDPAAAAAFQSFISEFGTIERED